MFTSATRPVRPATFLFSLFFLSACSHHQKNSIKNFNTLNEGLKRSSDLINKNNMALYTSLTDKLVEFTTAGRAKAWLPKVVMVRKLSSDLIKFIDEVKEEMIKKFTATGNRSDWMTSDNPEAVLHFFSTNKTALKLEQRLRQYRADVLKIDTSLNKMFQNTLLVTSPMFDNPTVSRPNFATEFFSEVPASAAIAMLSYFQHNIYMAENRILMFCNDKCTIYNDLLAFSYSAIIGQNSAYVRPGQQVEITAGLGSFVHKPEHQILINGKTIETGQDGTAVYTTKASGREGKHIIPVKISFTNDATGKIETIGRNVEYVVGNCPETEQ